MPDNTENKRKTLANCKLSEFTAQANKVRQLVHDYYKSINVPEIANKYKDKYKGIDVEEKRNVTADFINDIINAMMTEHPVETVQIIAAAAFMTYDEAEELAPSEALEIILECGFSQKVIDFFINVERLAQKDTAGILPTLIFLRQAISAMNSSDSESPNSTTDISEKSMHGDMSENA